MTAPTPPSNRNLGFLSVFQDGNGFVGGYLVTNPWGRPMEFRLTSAVQPNKVQQILYGATLPGYLCGEVIGKTLLEKATSPVEWVLVDNPLALDLRLHVDIPVALWSPLVDPDQPAPGLMIQPHVYCHCQFPQDVGSIRTIVENVAALDFGEPFARIREAMSEARKMGVASRSMAA